MAPTVSPIADVLDAALVAADPAATRMQLSRLPALNTDLDDASSVYSSSSSGCSASLMHAPPSSSSLRPNEHLAVLLDKHLWKPDSTSSSCDFFYCRTPFGIFERRHHCRKCGGVFCRACSSRSTPLLDVRALPFLQPPRGHSIFDFQSEKSLVLNARVCIECYDQIHGVSRPPSIHDARVVDGEGSRASSPASSAILTPPLRSLRSKASMASLVSTSSSGSSSRIAVSVSHASLPSSATTSPHIPAVVPKLPGEPSYGPLDAYPLARCSALCKLSGGGRWQPAPSVVQAGKRTVPLGDRHMPWVPQAADEMEPDIPEPVALEEERRDRTRRSAPWGKAPYEVEWERQERRARRQREGLFVKDGEFRYRLPMRTASPPAAVPVPARTDTDAADSLGISWHKPQESMLGVPRSLVAQSTF
ncbi:FYVE zinc finger-domain-containing protein [Schizophyllum amplum]|uniref:FYVE zinc finger-domain-containing protein n=1 Tax=Schizophyllum amplum TaxID=97359 RepID=A0A550CDT2_9AGAR|nr:FYVE zinc finger-domain-containing protein [Auriculariopsis ampla]